jgi:hypothetical protein
MANNFAADLSCVALWRFENGALDTDSIGTNTLSEGGSPAADTVNFLEGAASLSLGGSAYVYRTDANLAAGFPLKDGDATKLITVCCWVKVTSGETIWSKFKTSGGRSLCLRYVSPSFKLMYGTSASGSSEYTLGACSTGVWYHISVMVDGVNGRIWAIIYNNTTGVTQFYSNTGLAALYVGTAQWSIGERGANEGYKLTGKMDEVVVFNALKNYSELLAIRQQTFAYPVVLPANVFSGDSRFKAWWKFDTTANFLVDSIGSNTLVLGDGGAANPYADLVFSVKSPGSGVLNRTTSYTYEHVHDANLDAGFPLKNGDTVKQITVCLWIPPNYNTSGSYNQYVWIKGPSSSPTLGLCYTGGGSPANQLFVRWNGETFNLGIGLTADRFWHVAVVADGVNKTLRVRVYDTVSGTATNYTAFTPAAVLSLNTDPWMMFGNNADAYGSAGFMDEVVVAAALLSDAEIDAIRDGTFAAPPPQEIYPASIASEEAFGTPLVILSQPIYPTGIVSGEEFGTPTLLIGPSPCRSLTICEDIPAPPEDCRSLTTCTSIGGEPPADCRSLTTCSDLGLNRPDAARSLTLVQDVPLRNGGLFLVF